MASKGKTQKSRKRLSPARKDTLLRKIENDVGSHHWASILQWSSDPRARRLMEMMLDPAYQRFSMARLAERAGLKAMDLLDLFRRYHIAEAILIGCWHLPQVMEDTIEAALNKTDPCRRCDGLKTVDEGRICPACNGAGQVLKPGDKDARRLFFELVGMLGRNRRPVVIRPRAPSSPGLERVVTVAEKALENPEHRIGKSGE